MTGRRSASKRRTWPCCGTLGFRGRHRAQRVRGAVPLLRRVHEAQRILRRRRGDAGRAGFPIGLRHPGERAQEAAQGHQEGGDAPVDHRGAAGHARHAIPEGQSLRYRSSTNNEDLPGFSGAGLYDSKTQDPEETEEDGIDKSIKGVWASLWNFRAFTEREFHRIDHRGGGDGGAGASRITPTNWPTASPSASTPSAAATAATTSTRSWARTWSPILRRTRRPRKCCCTLTAPTPLRRAPTRSPWGGSS